MSGAVRALATAVLCTAVACRSAPRDEGERVGVDSVAGVTPAPAPEATTPPAPPATPTPSIAAPVIVALVPDSVRLAPSTISEVTVRGRGFAATGTNTVRIGPITLSSVPANAAGTEIRVTVPNRYTTNAEAPPRPLFPGDYPVTVETGGQTSNSKMLKVLP